MGHNTITVAILAGSMTQYAGLLGASMFFRQLQALADPAHGLKRHRCPLRLWNGKDGVQVWP
jgi:hypothetical protein